MPRISITPARRPRWCCSALRIRSTIPIPTCLTSLAGRRKTKPSSSAAGSRCRNPRRRLRRGSASWTRPSAASASATLPTRSESAARRATASATSATAAAAAPRRRSIATCSTPSAKARPGRASDILGQMSPLTPRYLVPFHPRELPHFFADVLIIGGGLAGLRAANAVDPRLSVLVVTKDAIDQSNSSYAQGGIAGVMDPEDRFEDHVKDTLVAGGTLCDHDVVEMVVREAPERIQELVDWGTHFDEQAGHILLGREGGHSHNRI